MVQGTTTGTTVIINTTSIRLISITCRTQKPRRMIMYIKAQGESE